METAFCGDRNDYYRTLVKMMQKIALFRLNEGQLKVMNRVFALPNSEGSQRLIIDAPSANRVPIAPAKIENDLPISGHLARFSMPSGRKL